MPDTLTPPPGFQMNDALTQQFGFPVATNAQGQRVRMRPTPAGHPGPTPRPEWGSGAVELPNGQIVRYGPRGGMTVLGNANGGSSGSGGGSGSVQAGADVRGRINLALDPVIEAQRRMSGMEAQGNPYGDPRSIIAQSLIDGDQRSNGEARNGIQTRVGRFIGGDHLQTYDQAASTFESSLMPVFSGSAVTASEASRFIRANLPELGDSPAILSQKSRNRQMIINAAARISGAPEPFPDVPSWSAGRAPGAQHPDQSQPHGGQMTPQQQALMDRLRADTEMVAQAGQSHAAPHQPAQPRVLTFNPRTGRLE